MPQAAEQVVIFLTNFYKTFPEFSNVDVCIAHMVISLTRARVFLTDASISIHLDLLQTYLAGESYAGQYIPYIAQAILDTTSISTPLKGILMGNAWINPEIQYPAYIGMSLRCNTECPETKEPCAHLASDSSIVPDFAYNKGILGQGSAQAKVAETYNAACLKAISTKEGANHVLVSVCEDILGPILDGGQKT